MYLHLERRDLRAMIFYDFMGKFSLKDHIFNFRTHLEKSHHLWQQCVTGTINLTVDEIL